VKRATRTLLTVLVSAALAMVGLVAVPANATVEWVTTPTWQNLHAKIEDGVFERVKREFDTSSRLLVDSETQHDIAWVRTDRNTVTVQYQGGVANAGRKVQFVMSGDVAFTDSISDPDNIAITDSNGVAEVTLTLGVTPVAETDLRVGLSSGDAPNATTVGNLVLDWEDPGFFPIIKLVGAGQGFTSQCLYRAENAQHQVSRAHECTNGGFQEFTWAWSVFKKDWLPEYSQVYVKSYKYGTTLNLNYRVTDIWGTVQANRDIHLIVDQGCRLCRWNNFDADKATDDNGLVSFSVQNKNSFKEVNNNRFVNSDTKAKEGGFIALSIQPTTNALDESADYIWPQIVTDVNIKASASTVTTVSRGGQDVNAQGDYVTTVNGQSVTNPPLALDTLDAGINDIDVVTLNISYMKNSLPIALYSPEIQVTADNGGKAAIFDVLRPISGLTSASSFQSPLLFNYTYPQKIALMCTKTGLTTFKIYTGTAFKTHTMSCGNTVSDAKNIESVPLKPAVPGSPAQATFKVTDRWGNPVAGVTVAFSATGNGSLTTSTAMQTNADGLVAADITATGTGAQTVSATVQDGNHLTQVASGTSTVNSTVNWGALAVTATPAKKSVTFDLYNLQGQKVTILEGKAKTYVTPSTGHQVFLKKYAKGKHTLKVSSGSFTQTFVVTVS
jgi:hypothetical protein